MIQPSAVFSTWLLVLALVTGLGLAGRGAICRNLFYTALGQSKACSVPWVGCTAKERSPPL